MVWGIVGSGLEKKRKIIVNHKEQENKKITLDLHQEWLHTTPDPFAGHFSKQSLFIH